MLCIAQCTYGKQVILNSKDNRGRGVLDVCWSVLSRVSGVQQVMSSTDIHFAFSIVQVLDLVAFIIILN